MSSILSVLCVTGKLKLKFLGSTEINATYTGLVHNLTTQSFYFKFNKTYAELFHGLSALGMSRYGFPSYVQTHCFLRLCKVSL